MSTLDDIKDTLGVRDLFSAYKGINQIKIDNAFAKSQNTINELNASYSLQRLNNGAVTGANQVFNPNAATGTNKMLGYALLAAAALAAGYLLVKK